MSDRPIHEVLAEISAKVPPEEWAKLDKTHYADPDTLSTLAKLERENAALRAELERVRKDAERLDWMEDVSKCYWVQVDAQPDGHTVRAGQGTGLRAAIDAAIAQGRGGK